VVSTAGIAEPHGVSAYNFTLADDHTGFVEGSKSNNTTGTAAAAPLDAVWVHNDCAAAENELADTSNLATPLGCGTGGRTVAANLSEQLAMKQVMPDQAGCAI
jgi:hypothetical protein